MRNQSQRESSKQASLRNSRRASPRLWFVGSALTLGLASLFLAKPSQAESPDARQVKIACAKSFEQTQRLRNDSHYLSAAEEAMKCARQSCGEALFDECTKIYSELQTATPSVVLSARAPNGDELTKVSVSVDGKPALDELDGKPMRLDPGNHTFSFSSAEHGSIEHEYLIRAGEQFRAITIDFAPEKTGQGDANARDREPNPSGPTPSRRPPLASYVLGGVSVVGLGAFIGFRIAGSHEFDARASDCKPTCSSSQVESIRQKYVLSDIALGVSAAATAAAVTIYLVAPAEPAPRAALQLTPVNQGLVAHLAGHF
jgi:hypothetical protein